MTLYEYVELPRIFLENLRASPTIGHFFRDIDEQHYVGMMQSILAAVLGDVAYIDIERLIRVHKTIEIDVEAAAEWSKCLTTSIASMDSVDKVKMGRIMHVTTTILDKLVAIGEKKVKVRRFIDMIIEHHKHGKDDVGDLLGDLKSLLIDL